MSDTKTAPVVTAGFAVLLTISSVALLHANEAEFIMDRFDNINEFRLSLFDSVLYAAYLISGIATGFLGARTGKRVPFILTGTAGTAAATLLMPLAPTYFMLLVLRFIQGIFCVMAWQTLMTLILDWSNETNRGRNMGIFGLFMALAMGLSPMAGGFLAGAGLFYPYYAAAAECAAAFLITLLLLSRVKKERQVRPVTIEKALRFASEKKMVIVPALFNFVDRLHMSFIIFIIPLLLREVLGLGPEYRGMLLAINGGAYIVLQYPVGKLSDRIGRKKLLITGSVGYGVILCLTGWAGSFGLKMLAVMLLILGLFSGLTGPPNSALVGDIVEKSENPLAMGFFNFIGNIGMITGALFAGWLLSFTSYTGAFIGAGLIELLSLGCNLILLRRFNRTGNKNSAAHAIQ